MDNYISPDDIFAEGFQSWQEFWNGDTPYQKTSSLLNHCIALPRKDLQWRIVISYLWTNPKFSKVLPLLFCWGREGTGKSTLGAIASALRDVPIINQSSTMVSIRNLIQSMKFMDDEGEFERDGSCLILDNCYSSTFAKNVDMLSLFLIYKRNSDTMQISGMERGTNQVFRCFSNRIISSVEPLHLSPELKELKRRTYVVKHARLEDLSNDDISEFNSDSPIDVNTCNWEGFNDEYLKFWNDRIQVEFYAKILKSLRKSNKIHSHIWEVSRELIATGICIGAWESAKDAVNNITDYWEWIEESGNSDSLLRQIIAEEFLVTMQGRPVSNKLLQSFLALKLDAGVLLEKPNARILEHEMSTLGYALRRSGNWERIS